MKIRFIINPISGTGKQKDVEKYISKHLKNYEIIHTKKTGDATRISKEAVNENIDAVIAVGGDGTINECLKGLVNTNTALGVIPCGSGNGFANHIGMDRTIEKAIKQLKDTRVDIIDSCTVNGSPFVNISGTGFDAHIANLFLTLTERGFVKYAKLVLRELSYNAKEYTISYNNIERKVKAYMINFANASQYGNNARISPMADFKDGLIDFVIVKDFPKWKIPIFIYMLLTSKIHLSKQVEIIQCQKMTIKAENTLIHLDGEPFKSSNTLEVTILPKSLKILMPNG
ncbi:MAG: diacylglycerol kinase family lipid kinase [Flavobacteriales bacterium]|nr:diacylglycerol kinase family lipid kinase [Flavobacteriales bacterium]